MYVLFFSLLITWCEKVSFTGHTFYIAGLLEFESLHFDCDNPILSILSSANK